MNSCAPTFGPTGHMNGAVPLWAWIGHHITPAKLHAASVCQDQALHQPCPPLCTGIKPCSTLDQLHRLGLGPGASLCVLFNGKGCFFLGVVVNTATTPMLPNFQTCKEPHRLDDTAPGAGLARWQGAELLCSRRILDCERSSASLSAYYTQLLQHHRKMFQFCISVKQEALQNGIYIKTLSLHL